MFPGKVRRPLLREKTWERPEEEGVGTLDEVRVSAVPLDNNVKERGKVW